MNLNGSRYDPSLAMFVDAPRDADLPRLRFLRWLAERGLLEHRVAGAPAGEHAVKLLIDGPENGLPKAVGAEGKPKGGGRERSGR